MPDDGTKKARFLPVIGVGHVGGEMLATLVQTWKNQGWAIDQLPWLWVDVLAPGEARHGFPDFAFPSSHVVCLAPDWAEIEDSLRNTPERWEYLRWYQPDNRRSWGRMALYTDLGGGSRTSKLWHALEQLAVRHQEIGARVIGAAWEDVVSGMYVDLAYLITLVSQGIVPVELWLIGPTETAYRLKGRRYDPVDMPYLTQVTMREIGRFQRNDDFTFQFASAQKGYHRLSSQTTHKKAIVQKVFYFDGQQATRQLVTTLRTLVGKMEDKFRDIWQQHQNLIGNTVNRQTPVPVLNGVVALAGARLMTDPAEQYRSAIAMALARSIIYSPSGICPQEVFQGGQSRPLPPVTIRTQKILTEVKEFLATFQNRYSYQFFKDVAAYANRLLNDDEAGISVTLAFLRLLSRSLKTSGAPEWTRRAVEELRDALQKQHRSLTHQYAALVQHYTQTLQQMGISPGDAQYWAHYKELTDDPQASGYRDQASLWVSIRQRLGWLVQDDMRSPQDVQWLVGWFALPAADIPDDIRELPRFFVDSATRLHAHAIQLSEEGVLASRLASLRGCKIEIPELIRWYQEVYPPTQYYDMALDAYLQGELEVSALVASPRLDTLPENINELKGGSGAIRIPTGVGSVVEPLLPAPVLAITVFPVPMETLHLFTRNTDWKTHSRPEDYVHRGEQLLALGENDRWTSTAPFRTFIQEQEENIIPFTQAWVLLCAHQVAQEDETEGEADNWPDQHLLERIGQILQGLGLPFEAASFPTALKQWRNRSTEQVGSLKETLRNYLRQYPRFALRRARYFRHEQLRAYWKTYALTPENEYVWEKDCGVLLTAVTEHLVQK